MIYANKQNIERRIETLYKNVNDLKNGNRKVISHYYLDDHMNCCDKNIDSFIDDLRALDELVKSEYKYSTVSFDSDGFVRFIGTGNMTGRYKDKMIDKYLKEISELEEKLSKFDSKDYEVYLQLKERFKE